MRQNAEYLKRSTSGQYDNLETSVNQVTQNFPSLEAVVKNAAAIAHASSQLAAQLERMEERNPVLQRRIKLAAILASEAANDAAGIVSLAAEAVKKGRNVTTKQVL